MRPLETSKAVAEARRPVVIEMEAVLASKHVASGAVAVRARSGSQSLVYGQDRPGIAPPPSPSLLHQGGTTTSRSGRRRGTSSVQSQACPTQRDVVLGTAECTQQTSRGEQGPTRKNVTSGPAQTAGGDARFQVDPDKREERWSASVFVSAWMKLLRVGIPHWWPTSRLGRPAPGLRSSSCSPQRPTDRSGSWSPAALSPLASWLEWNLWQGRLGVLASFRDVWRIALEGSVRSVWQLCVGQLRAFWGLLLCHHAGQLHLPSSRHNVIQVGRRERFGAEFHDWRLGVWSLAGWRWACRRRWMVSVIRANRALDSARSCSGVVCSTALSMSRLVRTSVSSGNPSLSADWDFPSVNDPQHRLSRAWSRSSSSRASCGVCTLPREHFLGSWAA